MQIRKRRSHLDTFVAPRPSPRLIGLLVPVNRVVCLSGIPGLRDVPWLNRLPIVRGLCDVVRIDFPRSDQERLLLAVNAATAAFIVPNHPEFFTDWMLDKELSARVAPLMASWATHEVVNGMGRLAQCFWLKNNLIAQIPGEGGAAGKTYSVEWALRGHGVLLHPEGNVVWQADRIQPLFPGVVDMALDAVQLAHARELDRRVLIAPVVWKLRFVSDVRHALEHEMTYVERKLALSAAASSDLGARVYAAYQTLLERDAQAVGATTDPGAHYFARQARLLSELAQRIRSALSCADVDLAPPAADVYEEMPDLLRLAERWLRNAQTHDPQRDGLAPVVKISRRLLRLTPGIYRGQRLSQEQVAENIKRLRADYCFGSLRDSANRFVPRPAGPRVAHIRTPEPLDITLLSSDAALRDDEHARALLLELLRERMQTELDALNLEVREQNAARTCANPFRAP